MKISQLQISGRDSKYVFLSIFVAVTVAVSLLFSYGYLSGYFTPQVTKIYYADNISPAHQMVIDDFNSNHAGRIEVIPIDLPFIKFNTNLRNELLSRSLRNQNSIIDVFAIDQVWNSRFSIWAANLDSLIPLTTQNSLLPNVLINARSQGHLVSLPLHTDVGLLFYRKDLVSEMKFEGDLVGDLKASLTWEKFIELGKMNGQTNRFYTFQGSNYEGLTVNFMEHLGPRKTNIVFDLDSMNINAALFIQGAQQLHRLVYSAQLSPVEVFQFNENKSYDFALKNDVPFFRGWPSFFQNIHESSLEHLIGIAALPHNKGEPVASVLGGWNLMISKHSKVKTEAAIFFNYMVSPKIQEKMLKIGGYMPVVASLYSDPRILAEVEHLPFLKNLVDNGFYRPAVPQYTQLSQMLADTLHSYLLPDANKN